MVSGGSMSDLLEQFLAQECMEHVRRLLDAALADSTRQRHHFEFNRFEVTIEREANIVVLDDVLDATEAGSRLIPLAEFTTAITQRSRS